MVDLAPRRCAPGRFRRAADRLSTACRRSPGRAIDEPCPGPAGPCAHTASRSHSRPPPASGPGRAARSAPGPNIIGHHYPQVVRDAIPGSSASAAFVAADAVRRDQSSRIRSKNSQPRLASVVAPTTFWLSSTRRACGSAADSAAAPSWNRRGGCAEGADGVVKFIGAMLNICKPQTALTTADLYHPSHDRIRCSRGIYKGWRKRIYTNRRVVSAVCVFCILVRQD